MELKLASGKDLVLSFQNHFPLQEEPFEEDAPIQEPDKHTPIKEPPYKDVPKAKGGLFL